MGVVLLKSLTFLTPLLLFLGLGFEFYGGWCGGGIVGSSSFGFGRCFWRHGDG